MWLETLYIYTRHTSKSNVRHIQDFVVLWKLKLSQFLKFLPLTLNLKTIVKCYIPFKKKTAEKYFAVLLIPMKYKVAPSV